jgi:hypothetical protein
MSISLASLLWTLPIMFMIHEFEEIIMFRPWYDKYGNWLKTHHPRIDKRLSTLHASTPALSLGILEEFIILSIVTLFCVENEYYSLWVGILMGIFIHHLIHIGSFFFKRGYVPSVITSVISFIYTLVVLILVDGLVQFNFSEIFKWTLISLVLLIINLKFLTILIEKFDKWLTQWIISGQNNIETSNKIMNNNNLRVK